MRVSVCVCVLSVRVSVWCVLCSDLLYKSSVCVSVCYLCVCLFAVRVELRSSCTD